METWIRTIDQLSKAIGHAFAWCVLVLTASTCFEVFMRYALRAPTAWAFDMSYMLYGALFIMSGAYALSRGSHVRGDFIYRKWAPRTQARLDIVLYVFFYFPGVLAMVFVGGAYGAESMRILEASANSPAGVPVWPLKMLICVAGVTLTLAGIAEVLRCLVCLRTGRWPARGGDVEELDVVLKERHAAEVEK